MVEFWSFYVAVLYQWIVEVHANESVTLTTLEGHDVILTCPALEDLQSLDFHKHVRKLEWFRNGALIGAFSQGKESAEWWVGDARYSLDRSHFALTISPSLLLDKGFYACIPTFDPIFKDQLLKNSNTLKVDVIGSPSPPGKPIAIFIGSRSVELIWTPSVSHPDGPVLTYQIFVSRIITEQLKADDFEAKSVCPGNVTRLLIENLTPFTQYAFYSIAENFAGRSQPSKQSDVLKTAGEAPSVPPAIVELINSTNGSVLMAFTPPSDPSTVNGPILGYKIGLEDVASSNFTEFYINDRHTTAYRFSTLKPYTSYKAFLQLDNGFGLSPPIFVSFSTPEKAPLDAPEISTLKIISGREVEISWIPPRIPNGILISYTIYGSSHSREKRCMQFVQSVDARVTSIVLNHLIPYCPYQLKISASTSLGEGPTSETTSFVSDTSEPSEPKIDSILLLHENIISISWTSPSTLYRKVDFYTVTVWKSNFFEWKQSLDSTEATKAQINLTDNEIYVNGVELSVRYLINVRAVTASIVQKDRYYTGEHSETHAFVVLKRKSPENSNTILYTSICTKLGDIPVVNGTDTGFFTTGGSILYNRNVGSSINWKKFISNRTIFDGSEVKKVDDVDFQQLSPNENKIDGIFCDPSLKYDNFTEKIDQLYGGEFTPPVISTNVNFHRPRNTNMITLIILGVIGLLVFMTLVVLILFLIWKKYFTYKQYKFDGLSTVVSEIEDNCSFDGVDCPAISSTCFEDYVENLFLNDCAGLTKEYQSVDPVNNDQCLIQPKLSFDNSIVCENKPKNRYVNIVAYDHSRVALRHVVGCKYSDYINANFIDGYKRPRAYIATQGPLPNTFGDFWRMIWEQRCLVIVMITNVIERGRKKCDQYWPSSGESKYDDFVVKLINEHVTAFYTLRTLTLRHNRTLAKGAERMVLHYHYTHWPDHGVPDCIPPVLAFVIKSSNANRDNTAPIVVHCSAGVGRSGTYIVIDAMLKQLKAANTLNVYGYLKHIRRQRNFLVQTEEQYAFCYNVILEAIKCGMTEMSISEFVNYCAEKGNFVSSNHSMIEQQYNLIYDFKYCGLPFTEAYKVDNHDKNRHSDIVTCDRYRVPILSKSDDGDYINATFFPGYRYFDEFIITQYPMESTIEDFWRMICEYEVQFIILLHDTCDEEQTELSKFWPQDLNEELHLSNCALTLNRLSTGDDWLCMDILMTRKDEEMQSTCRIIQCPKWADGGRSLADTWQVVYWLQEWQTIHSNSERSISRMSSGGGAQQSTYAEKRRDSPPPTVVVDLYGAKKAAQFCALSTLCYQIEQDSCLDVYQIAKVYTQRRSGIFQALDDYSFIYFCVEYLLNCGSKIEEMRDNASNIIENSSSTIERKCFFSYPKNLTFNSNYDGKSRPDDNSNSRHIYTNNDRRSNSSTNDLLIQISDENNVSTTANLFRHTKDTIL